MGLLSMGVGLGNRLMGIFKGITILAGRRMRWFLLIIRVAMPLLGIIIGNLTIQLGRIFRRKATKHMKSLMWILSTIQPYYLKSRNGAVSQRLLFKSKYEPQL